MSNVPAVLMVLLIISAFGFLFLDQDLIEFDESDELSDPESDSLADQVEDKSGFWGNALYCSILGIIPDLLTDYDPCSSAFETGVDNARDFVSKVPGLQWMDTIIQIATLEFAPDTPDTFRYIYFNFFLGMVLYIGIGIIRGFGSQ